MNFGLGFLLLLDRCTVAGPPVDDGGSRLFTSGDGDSLG